MPLLLGSLQPCTSVDADCDSEDIVDLREFGSAPVEDAGYLKRMMCRAAAVTGLDDCLMGQPWEWLWTIAS